MYPLRNNIRLKLYDTQHLVKNIVHLNVTRTSCILDPSMPESRSLTLSTRSMPEQPANYSYGKNNSTSCRNNNLTNYPAVWSANAPRVMCPTPQC